MPSKEEIQVAAMKQVIEKIKQLAKKTRFLIVPSPNRITPEGEYSDYETAAFYRRWMESGQDREGYWKHQEEGFPLFELVRKHGPLPTKSLGPVFPHSYEGYFGLKSLKGGEPKRQTYIIIRKR